MRLKPQIGRPTSRICRYLLLLNTVFGRYHMIFPPYSDLKHALTWEHERGNEMQIR